MEKRSLSPELRDVLFSVIRSGMETGTSELQLSPETCRELLRFGAAQSIFPIIYHGLERMEVPKEALQDFNARRLKELYSLVQRDEALCSVSSALEAENIPYILLKGAVLRELYPRPELRTSCDIDILVREETLEQAVAAIECRTDFKTQKRAYHDISMLNGSFHLELHFSIKENEENLDRLLVRAWEYAQPTGEGCRYAFTPEFQIFHVTAHMCYHLLHGGLGIRPFLDLWLLRNKTAFEEASVRAMCESCGIQKFYEACCALSQVWMEQAPHTETSAQFEAFCLSGGVFGSSKFKNAARQREARGIKYVLRRVFPPASQVKDYYGNHLGRHHALPYYYAKRLLSWTGRSRRKELQTQLKQIMSSDQAYLDSTDKFFQQLGL